MTDKFQYRVLVVDDERSIRDTLGAILQASGYSAVTAEDGFAALRSMKEALPEVILCDLRMPNMSGFELLSIVRRRFPSIGVIAFSGEFLSASIPRGVLADAFLQKGAYSPEELLGKIRELLNEYPLRPLTKQLKAPLWVPKRDQNYIVITCTDCFRSFPVDCADPGAECREVICEFCGTKLEYLIDEAAAELIRLKNEGLKS